MNLLRTPNYSLKISPMKYFLSSFKFLFAMLFMSSCALLTAQQTLEINPNFAPAPAKQTVDINNVKSTHPGSPRITPLTGEPDQKRTSKEVPTIKLDEDQKKELIQRAEMLKNKTEIPQRRMVVPVAQTVNDSLMNMYLNMPSLQQYQPAPVDKKGKYGGKTYIKLKQ